LISGGIYNLPYGMGEMRISKYIPHKENLKPRDFAAERDYFTKEGKWKKIKLSNLHTNGQKVRIKWIVRDYKQVPNKYVYRFGTSRSFRGKVAQYLKTTGNIENYIQSEPHSTKIKTSKTLI